MTKHMYVVGMDSFNEQELKDLQKIPAYADIRFHPLLGYDELRQGAGVHFDDLLEKAISQLRASEHPIDGIFTFWDFPAQSLVPLLCREFGCARPSLDSTERCEHKYYSRLRQQAIVPEVTPKFDVINPFDDIDSFPSFDYPYWIKPVKSFSSYLAFQIENDDDLRKAIEDIRKHIGTISEGFAELEEHADLPDEVARLSGASCIREEVLSGRLCTLEGYGFDGETTIYGIVDSVKEEIASSFARYQYPSVLPDEVQQRMVGTTEKLMDELPYPHGPFNIEYFWEPDSDSLRILEINPRISQSHCELFAKVDGQSHMSVAIDLAMGKRPEFPHRKGKFALAAKCHMRVHHDAKVLKVPSQADLDTLREQYPGVRVKLLVEEGERLSQMSVHDAYSYELADFYIGASNEDELMEIYHDCLNRLPFELTNDDEVDHVDDSRHQPRIQKRS